MAQCTAWCSEIGSLASLDAPEFRASSDSREPISLHQTVYILIRKAYLGRHPRHLQQALSSWISPGKQRQSLRTSPLFIHVQRPNKSFFQRSPLFQAATTWNRFVAATASRDLPSARDISNFFQQSSVHVFFFLIFSQTRTEMRRQMRKRPFGSRHF